MRGYLRYRQAMRHVHQPRQRHAQIVDTTHTNCPECDSPIKIPDKADYMICSRCGKSWPVNRD